MDDVQSLSHSKWRCKYHIVFAPKYRRQIIYKQIKMDVGKILRDLRKERSRDIRGRMLSRSYPHVSNDSTAFECIKLYGIFEE